jgi:hypothetical protein
LVLADDTILDVADENLGSAPTGNTSNELEYFGTQPESASADLSEDGGPSPAPQPLNVGDDLPRTTVAAPLNPSGNVAPNCLQFFVTAYRPAEAPWDPDAPNPNPVNFPDNRLTQYQSSVAHIGWDWDFVGTVTTLPRPPLEGNWPGFPSTGVGSNPLVNPGHLFNGPAVTLPSSRVDIRTDPVGNFQAVREERLIAVIHIRNMSDLFDGTGGIDCLVDDPAAPEIFAPASGLSQVAAGSGQSFILNSMDLHVNSDDGFGNSITHQVINLGRSNFYHSFDGVSLDNAHQIDMDPTVI